MDSILFIGLLAVVLIGLPVGLGVFFYFIIKKLGYPKTAKYLTIVYGLILVVIMFFIVFEDKLFTKNNAIELVEEQGFKLRDKFDLVKNESSSAIGDYYHTFILKISERDKENIILKIKNATNFKSNSNPVSDLLRGQNDRYFGKKIVQNYETEYSYVREYFQPSGQQGYAPTFRRISIDKSRNELTFEDINE